MESPTHAELASHGSMAHGTAAAGDWLARPSFSPDRQHLLAPRAVAVAAGADLAALADYLDRTFG